MAEKKISKIKSRMLQYADIKGLSKRQIYIDTGISNGVLDKTSGLTEQTIEKFLDAYSDVDPVWLITGSGKKPSVHNEPTLDDYSLVYEKAALREMSLSSEEAFVQASAIKDRRLKLAENAIPLISKSAADRFGSPDFFIEESDILDYYVIPSFNSKDVDFLITVDGDGMSPTYKSGDLVACRIIHEDSFLQYNKPHLIGTDQGLLIKRFQPISSSFYSLISDNADYHPIKLEREYISGIALIVGYLRPE